MEGTKPIIIRGPIREPLRSGSGWEIRHLVNPKRSDLVTVVCSERPELIAVTDGQEKAWQGMKLFAFPVEVEAK